MDRKQLQCGACKHIYDYDEIKRLAGDIDSKFDVCLIRCPKCGKFAFKIIINDWRCQHSKMKI